MQTNARIRLGSFTSSAGVDPARRGSLSTVMFPTVEAGRSRPLLAIGRMYVMDSHADVTVMRAERSHSLEELARIAAPHLIAAGVERAVVFGAYARGTADGYSDLDLAVVLCTDRPFLERWPLLSDLLDALPLPVDLLIYTPEEFARGLSRRVEIFDAIAREGITIHARS